MVLYGIAFTLIAACLPGHLALRLAAGSVQHRPRRDADRAGLSAGHVPVLTRLDTFPRSTLLIDWFAADRAARRAAPRAIGCSRIAASTTCSSATAPQRAGPADQRQGRRRHLHPRDAARPACGLPGRRDSRRHAVAGRPARSTGFRFSARSMRSNCGRAPRSPRQAAAKADHHRTEPAGRASPAAARPGRRAGDPARALAEAHRFPAAISTIPSAPSNRSRSRICSAARRPCSTATAWRG